MGLMKGEVADLVERLSGTVDGAGGGVSGVPVLDSAALGVDDLGMKDELAKGEAEPLAGIFVISTRSMAGDEARSSLLLALLPGLFLLMVRPAGMAGGVESLEEFETLATRDVYLVLGALKLREMPNSLRISSAKSRSDEIVALFVLSTPRFKVQNVSRACILVITKFPAILVRFVYHSLFSRVFLPVIFW